MKQKAMRVYDGTRVTAKPLGCNQVRVQIDGRPVMKKAAKMGSHMFKPRRITIERGVVAGRNIFPSGPMRKKSWY